MYETINIAAFTQLFSLARMRQSSTSSAPRRRPAVRICRDGRLVRGVDLRLADLLRSRGLDLDPVGNHLGSMGEL